MNYLRSARSALRCAVAIGLGMMALTGTASAKHARPGVAKQMTATGTGPFTVTIDYTLENFGSCALYNLSLNDELDGVFGEGNWDLMSGPELVAGSTYVKVNPDFTGIAPHEDLLDSSGKLERYKKAQVQIVLTVTEPGTYKNQVTLVGKYSGIWKKDLSTDGTDPDFDGNNDDGSVDHDNVPNEQVPSTVTLAAPEIGLAKRAEIGDGDDPFRVDLVLAIENSGTVLVRKMALYDDLDRTFGAGNYRLRRDPRVISDPGGRIVINDEYDGSTNTNILSDASRLDVGKRAEIELELDVYEPGFYENQARVEGNCIGAGLVEDLSQNGSVPDANGNGDPTDDSDPTPIVLEIQGTPVIGAAKLMKGSGSGPYGVVIDYHVENLGDVTIENLSHARRARPGVRARQLVARARPHVGLRPGHVRGESLL